MGQKDFYEFTCDKCGTHILLGRTKDQTTCALCTRMLRQNPSMTRDELRAYKDRLARAEVKMVDRVLRTVIPER